MENNSEPPRIYIENTTSEWNEGGISVVANSSYFNTLGDSDVANFPILTLIECVRGKASSVIIQNMYNQSTAITMTTTALHAGEFVNLGDENQDVRQVI